MVYPYDSRFPIRLLSGSIIPAAGGHRRGGLSLSDEASSGWENLKMSQAQFCSCRSMMLLLFTGQAIVVDGGQYRIG